LYFFEPFGLVLFFNHGALFNGKERETFEISVLDRPLLIFYDTLIICLNFLMRVLELSLLIPQIFIDLSIVETSLGSNFFIWEVGCVGFVLQPFLLV